MPGPEPNQLASSSRLATASAILLAAGWSLGVIPLAAAGTIASSFDSPAAYAAVWAGGVLYALLAAIALAGSDANGGYYSAVRARLGDYPAFAVGCGEWIAIIAAVAAAATVAGDFVVGLVPEARAPEVVALALVVVLTAVGWLGRRAGNVLQATTGLLALLALVAFAAGAFWLGSRSPHEAGVISAEREGPWLPASAIALQAAVIACSGWAAPLYAGGFQRPTSRRRMAAAVVAVAAVHVLMSAAMLRVVSLATISGSRLALETAAGRMLGGAYDGVRVLIALVLLGAASAGMAMAPRVLEAMAEDRMLWKGLASEASVLVSGAAVAALIVTGAYGYVLAAFAVILFAAQLLSFAGVAARRGSSGASRAAAGAAALAAAALLAATVAGRPARALPLLLMAATLPVCYTLRRGEARDRAALAVKSGSESRVE